MHVPLNSVDGTTCLNLTTGQCVSWHHPSRAACAFSSSPLAPLTGPGRPATTAWSTVVPLPLHACLLPQRVDGRTYPLDCSYVGMLGNANPIGRMAQCPLFRSVQNSSTVLSASFVRHGPCQPSGPAQHAVASGLHVAFSLACTTIVVTCSLPLAIVAVRWLWIKRSLPVPLELPISGLCPTVSAHPIGR